MRSKLLFVHIPKTAGTSFLSILNKTFSHERVFHVAGGSERLASSYYRQTGNILSTLEDVIIDNCDLIYGHMPFLNNSRFSKFSPITFLRDPVRRVVSDFRYTVSTPKNPLFHIVRNMSLSDYVSRNSDLHLDNLQVRLISGKTSGDIGIMDVEKAFENLKSRFSFFGFTERFAHSLVMFRDLMGMEKILIPRLNVTKGDKPDFGSGEIEAVKSYNRWDIELYKLALEEFEIRVNLKAEYFSSEILKMEDDSKKSYALLRRFTNILRKV